MEVVQSLEANSSTCQQCGGAGQIQYKQRTPFGQFVNIKTCDACHGEGKIITNPL